jgi:penicillin-binding protein 1A
VKAWVGGVDFKTFKYDHVNINTRTPGRLYHEAFIVFIQQFAESGPSLLLPLFKTNNKNVDGYGMVPNTCRTCTGMSMPMAQALGRIS